MGPDSREAVYDANGFVAQDASDLVYLPGATYVDPIFSWVEPIGVTGVCFLNSDKFGAQKNQVLVGNTNLGSLHLFQPNGPRTGLVLSGGTADMVADNAPERDQFLFGTGMGLITDVVMGPDGYAYACSISASAVYRIRPKTEVIAPVTATPGPGQIIAGNTSSLALSDDSRLTMRPTAVLVSTQPPVQLVVQATSPFLNPSSITVRIESSASIASALQKVSLYDWQSPGYVEVSSQVASTSDNLLTIPTTSPTRFVNSSDRTIRALITYKAQGAVLVYPWQARIDEFTWTVTR
jgi:hypothetical protein